MNERLGEVRLNTKGTPMKIIRYGNSEDIDIEFLDDFHYVKEHQAYVNFKNGGIKNPYDKNICGIGYLGVGKFHCKHPNGVHTMEYQNWIAMIRRCYDVDRQSTYPAYYGICEVCEEWYNFQVFARWYEENYYQVGNERMHIDKDILVKGNKIYSPETCILVPQRINMLFMKKPNKYGLPNGVKPRANGKYEAKYNGRQLGVYDTLELAVIAHDEEKLKAIIEIANEYKDKIPSKLYEALINWKPDYQKCA